MQPVMRCASLLLAGSLRPAYANFVTECEESWMIGKQCRQPEFWSGNLEHGFAIVENADECKAMCIEHGQTGCCQYSWDMGACTLTAGADAMDDTGESSMSVLCGTGGVGEETSRSAGDPGLDPAALTDVYFFDPAGYCEEEHAVLPNVDRDVPIPEFGVCFKNKQDVWNILECLEDGSSFKQTTYADKSCTYKTGDSVFVNGECNTSNDNFGMILKWDTKPCQKWVPTEDPWCVDECASLNRKECKSSELGCTWQKTCFSSDPCKCFPERSQAEQDAVCAGIVNDKEKCLASGCALKTNLANNKIRECHSGSPRIRCRKINNFSDCCGLPGCWPLVKRKKSAVVKHQCKGSFKGWY